MPRRERIKSTTGIYHIMLRGINRQVIFEDREDNEKFLDILMECKTISGYTIFAYCLMNNHVHLLMKEGTEELQTIFKRIGGRYVYWYNGKYSRNGHLFQDRYMSEAVETEEYIYTVIRYIHQNPVKAGIVENAEDYPYSSYGEYIGMQAGQLTDIGIAYDLFEREAFIEYHKIPNTDKCLEIGKESPRMTDGQAKEAILKISKCKNATEFQSLDAIKRTDYLRSLKNEGASIRQLSRLTGVSFGIVRKA